MDYEYVSCCDLTFNLIKEHKIVVSYTKFTSHGLLSILNIA